MFSVIFPGQGSQLIGMGKEFLKNMNKLKNYLKRQMKFWDFRYQKLS